MMVREIHECDHDLTFSSFTVCLSFREYIFVSLKNFSFHIIKLFYDLWHFQIIQNINDAFRPLLFHDFIRIKDNLFSTLIQCFYLYSFYTYKFSFFNCNFKSVLNMQSSVRLLDLSPWLCGWHALSLKYLAFL